MWAAAGRHAGGRQQLGGVGLRGAQPLRQGWARLGRDLPQVLGQVLEEVGALLRGHGGQVGGNLLQVPLGVQDRRLARGRAHAVFLSGSSIRTSMASAKPRHFLTQLSNSSRPAGVAP